MKEKTADELFKELGYDEKCADVINAIEHILQDYKRVLKENEEWQKTYQEEKDKQFEIIRKNQELEKRWDNDTHKLQNDLDIANAKIVELQKELNQENKKCMMLAIEKQDYFEKYRYHLQQNERLTKEFSNVIPVQKVKILLNLIEKLQKENEELKQDRNNNYQMIALAQNEALGYMQGYEDGQKSKRSAVAYIVENQQYYILNKQIEHYKEYIKKLQKENEEYSKQLDLDYVDKNYISKKKIEDTIEELKGKLENISKRREKSKTKEEKTVLWCLEIRTDERIKTLQELL